ncbi:hypothetical protein FSP39_019507 [Pinctada imbricata]|uniref:Uncharacterized protein n=1 Tax=Pinctada imbricata TaxID=66713 RepID=A0AA88XXD7_PINIB|nr:hypothetical protein FSP39_019507 [Pinctada imbricata]
MDPLVAGTDSSVQFLRLSYQDVPLAHSPRSLTITRTSGVRVLDRLGLSTRYRSYHVNARLSFKGGPVKMLMPFWWKPLPETDYVVKYPYGPTSKLTRQNKIFFLKQNDFTRGQRYSTIIFMSLMGLYTVYAVKGILTAKPKPKGVDHHHDALFPEVYDWVLKNLETFSKNLRQLKTMEVDLSKQSKA